MKEKYATTSTGVNLLWYPFLPTTPPPWPSVIVIHPGGFKNGNPTQSVAQELAAAGFMAMAIEHRLAPPHLDMNPRQLIANDDGHYPEQTDDVREAIRKARADQRCSGKVFAVGASSGGAHAVYFSAGVDRFDAVASLSGAYDLHDADSLSDPLRANFHQNVYNYVGSDDASNGGPLDNASPYKQITSDVSPIYIISSDNDQGMPLEQPGLLVARLDSVGATNYQVLLRPNSNEHAFSYWTDVKASVIDFLNQYV